MEDHPDGSVSPRHQPVEVNWETLNDLNNHNEFHAELDLDYDIVSSAIDICCK